MFLNPCNNKFTFLVGSTFIGLYGYILYTKGSKVADQIADSYEDKTQEFTNLAIELMFDVGEDIIKATTNDEINPIVATILNKLETKAQQYSNQTISNTFSVITNIMKASVEELKKSKNSGDLDAIKNKLQSYVTEQLHSTEESALKEGAAAISEQVIESITSGETAQTDSAEL